MGVIGMPLDRKDGRAKVTGRARYAAEMQVPGVAHAVLVQSTISSGSILAIETGEAAGMPGVLTIVTPDNAPKLNSVKPTMQLRSSPTLQDHSISYNGQHVAIVVADTLDRALAAAGKVRVTYREDEPEIDMDAGLARAYRPKEFRGGAREPDSRRGDPDGAYEAAPVKHEATYITPVEHHNAMEPHATIARWDGDKLTVWTATQHITGAQQTLSKLFGLKPEDVRVICPFVGGGFGSKGDTWPPATLAAMAARVVGRPVKLVLEREQMYTSNGYRPRTIQMLKLGARRDGQIVALRHDGFNQMSLGDFGEYSEAVGLGSEMLYAVPNVAITHRLVGVNQGLPTYMRAPGEAPGIFALESAIDELALKLDMDPLALRLKNYAETDPSENKPFSSKMLRECYSQGAEAFGWSRRPMTPRSLRDGRTLVGWGMATSTYPVNRMASQARIRLNADGSVLVGAGTQDIGTGTYTIMAQVAAEELGVPVERVTAELGDSLLPKAPVSGGSMTAASVMNAVAVAAAVLKSKLFELARADNRAGFAELDPAAMTFDGHAVVGGGRRVPVATLLARIGRDFIEADGEAKPGEEKKHFALHAFGAQFVEVRVDADLGVIRVSRCVGAFDVGRVLNAKTARSQLIGGITYGIGMALLEETLVDPQTGRYVNANLSDYLVPVNADIPQIQTIVVDNNERTSNPLGIKGLGELPMVGVAAAVANAVYHATGKRVRKLPIRLEDVLA
jgi:xanthine dehydrogenase YagR molybdenum-binding subunit